MNKKGQVTEFVVATVMILLTLSGTYLVVNQANKVYVGDNEGKVAYLLPKCEEQVKEISQENLILFKSKDDITEDFRIMEC